jgi:hypothetical protein
MATAITPDESAKFRRDEGSSGLASQGVLPDTGLRLAAERPTRCPWCPKLVEKIADLEVALDDAVDRLEEKNARICDLQHQLQETHGPDHEVSNGDSSPS